MKQSELKRRFLKVTKRFDKFLGGFGRLAVSNSDECSDPSKQVCTMTGCKFSFYEQIGHISPDFDSLLDSIVRDSKQNVDFTLDMLRQHKKKTMRQVATLDNDANVKNVRWVEDEYSKRISKYIESINQKLASTSQGDHGQDQKVQGNLEKMIAGQQDIKWDQIKSLRARVGLMKGENLIKSLLSVKERILYLFGPKEGSDVLEEVVCRQSTWDYKTSRMAIALMNNKDVNR